MRIAVYGGSFDPPHVGHAMVMGWLLWTDQVDEVWLVPAYQHAFGKRSAPFDIRVALCRAVAAAVAADRIRVSTVEADLPSPSYTIDTLDHLAATYPEHRFRLVVGADVVPETPRWKNWSAIEARYPPIVVGRDGYPRPEGAVVFPGVSSTEIRARLAAGESVEHLVPAEVAALLTGESQP